MDNLYWVNRSSIAPEIIAEFKNRKSQWKKRFLPQDEQSLRPTTKTYICGYT